MKNYQKYIDEINRIENEEKNIIKLFSQEFVSDGSNELIKLGAILEKDVDPESLGIRYKDTLGIFGMIKSMDIHWIQWGTTVDKNFGFYLHIIDLNPPLIQLYEIGLNKKGEKIFKCVCQLSPTSNLLNNKPVTFEKLLKIYYKDVVKKAPELIFKNDIKKYNL